VRKRKKRSTRKFWGTWDSRKDRKKGRRETRIVKGMKKEMS